MRIMPKCSLFRSWGARNVRNASHARNATRELNPCSNFTQATLGVTNHMASFHLIVTARAPVGYRLSLPPLPVHPC